MGHPHPAPSTALSVSGLWRGSLCVCLWSLPFKLNKHFKIKNKILDTHSTLIYTRDVFILATTRMNLENIRLNKISLAQKAWHITRPQSHTNDFRLGNFTETQSRSDMTENEGKGKEKKKNKTENTASKWLRGRAKGWAAPWALAGEGSWTRRTDKPPTSPLFVRGGAAGARSGRRSGRLLTKGRASSRFAGPGPRAQGRGGAGSAGWLGFALAPFTVWRCSLLQVPVPV